MVELQSFIVQKVVMQQLRLYSAWLDCFSYHHVNLGA